MNRISARLLLGIFIALTTILGCQARVQMTVENPRGKSGIGVGDKFYITITATNVDGDMARPSSVPGCDVIYFSDYTQSSFTSVNGKTTQSHSTVYTVTLQANREGKYTFGPVTVGGQKSNAVSYTIGAGGSGSRPSSVPGASQAADPNDGPKFIGTGNGNLFLRASVNKTTAYEQEALVYTVKLYTSYDNLKFLGATESPKFEGFTIAQSDETSRSFTFETVNGRTYRTAVISRYIIFPQMTGTRQIIGNTYKVSVDEREYYSEGYYGGFTISRPLEFNVKTNDIKIDVKPLPSPRPASFSGAVGKFNISSNLVTPSLKTNQNAEVIYTVTGRGNLKMVNLPDLSTIYPPQFEVYTPTVTVKDNAGVSDVSGSVIFDYSFLPLETGKYELPPVAFTYFNPETGKYETTTSKAFHVDVEKGKATSKSQTRNRLTFNQELMPIKSTSKSQTPWVYTVGYWMIYVGILAIFAIALFLYRKRLRDNANILATRSRRAGKMARRKLKRAHAAMQRNDRALFYTELLTGVYGYLADKLSIPASELNRENVAEILGSKGIAKENIEELLHIIDEVELSRYSPVETAVPMQTLYDNAFNLINNLQSDLGKASPKPAEPQQ